MPESQAGFHRAFLASQRVHILNITNHGIHQWDIIPGLTDTGGQNVFVNQFSDSLVDLGYKVTIVNRGGFEHPVTGEKRVGLHYKNEYQRICYLEDGLDEFVRKEDMAERIPSLAVALEKFTESEGSSIQLLISHYWDALAIGISFNRNRFEPIHHVWVPHSLGVIKKNNVTPDQWDELRVDERIAMERNLIQQVDHIGVTSVTIRDVLTDEYGYRGQIHWLPPCINTTRFYPRTIEEHDPIWEYLSSQTGLSVEILRSAKIITEISRTVSSKRKDILIKAFSMIYRRHPNILLIITIDPAETDLYQELTTLISSTGAAERIAVLGSIWNILPSVYTITDIYCMPSVMEGFGMSAQEAAATRVPVVASDKVPFASEFLLGDKIETIEYSGDKKSVIRIGEGAIVIPADDVDGFARALELLLEDDELRARMANRAYQRTIPAFTWNRVVSGFLVSVGMGLK